MYNKDNSQCILPVYTDRVRPMSTPQNQFGEWLRAWRKEADLGQAALGKKVDVTKQHISNLERGEVSSYTGEAIRPSFDLTLKLARVLKRPIGEACAMAGYDLPEGEAQPQPQTVEEALQQAGHLSSLSESQLALIRPLLAAIDQTVDALTRQIPGGATVKSVVEATPADNPIEEPERKRA